MPPPPVRLLVEAADLTPGGALRGSHRQVIQDVLRRDRGFALIPSDTCYSLAAIPTGLSMSRQINRILDRKEEPISLAYDGIRRVESWVRLDALTIRLLEHLTPGPLTVVCPLREDVHPQITDDVLAAPDRTIGVRIPDSRIETQLVDACDSPLTTVAVRAPGTKEALTDLQQAKEVVLAGLKRLENPPPIAVVEARLPFAKAHSTVVRVPGLEGALYDVIRRGAITETQIDDALSRLSQWEIAASR